jgi:hypothetical protein
MNGGRHPSIAVCSRIVQIESEISNFKFEISDFAFEIFALLAFPSEANDGIATVATGGSSGIADISAVVARVGHRRSRRAGSGDVQGAPVSSAH